MGNIKIDFFGVPLAVIVVFMLLEYLLFAVFYFNSAILILFAILLFVTGVIFMKAAGRTGSQAKEGYFSALSAIFIYFSIFEIPLFLKFITLKFAGFVFVILFLLFIVLQRSSFKNIIINTSIILFLIAKMLFSIQNPTFAYYSIVTGGALILSAFIIYRFGNSQMSFERTLFAQISLPVSIIVMLWGIARLVR